MEAGSRNLRRRVESQPLAVLGAGHGGTSFHHLDLLLSHRLNLVLRSLTYHQLPDSPEATDYWRPLSGQVDHGAPLGHPAAAQWPSSLPPGHFRLGSHGLTSAPTTLREV